MGRLLRIRHRISAQLYAGLGGAVLLTVAASLVGLFFFARVGEFQSRVNEGSVPELAAAFGVARYSGTLVEAGPRLTAAATPGEVARVTSGIEQARRVPRRTNCHAGPWKHAGGRLDPGARPR